MEMIFGVLAFVVLFAVWVVVPTIVKRRHTIETEEEGGEY